MKRRLSANASLVGLALIASGIEPDPEIALIPLAPSPMAPPKTGSGSGPMPGPMSTNLHTREGRALAAYVRELVPGVDLDTIKGMLRNEVAAWERASDLLKKAYGS